MIDFDNIDDWERQLGTALEPLVSKSARAQIAAATPKYVEDARDLLFRLSDRGAIVEATLNWIRSTSLAAYHGSRLTDNEVASVRANGLLPLRAEQRRTRITRALSSHPRWHDIKHQLDPILQSHGSGEKSGVRENQVHLTISRAGLAEGFNHYLTHGSEFDQHVAYALLGQEGKDLLARDGEPRMIQVEVPGSIAIDTAHPFFKIDHLLSQGDVPNLVNQFLSSWSYRLSKPGFQCRTLEVDCGMFFRSSVPAAWIRQIDSLS